MALLAFDYGVRAEQRKPVEMLLNRLDRHLPAENRMALCAVFTELSAVNVSMAIGAVLSNVGEYRFGVASRAGNFFVHAAKRILRSVVVEFRYGANGGPACVRVAIFAGNVEGTVRTPSRQPLRGCQASRTKGYKNEYDVPTRLRCSVNDCPQRIYLTPTLL
jgi:hypothetical protein